MKNILDSIPSNWEVTKLKNISMKINSGFPSGKWNREEKKGIPHLRPMNINEKGNIDLSNIKYVYKEKYDPLIKYDVLFNNTNSPELLGKTTYIVKDTEWAYSNHMTRIRFNTKLIFSPYISHFLHYLFYIRYYKMNCRHHVNQASINSSELGNISIPLPPYNEQVRIVAKIEELFSRLDQGVKNLRETQQKLEQYKKTILISAFTGCMTQKWRSNNTIKQLLYKEITYNNITLNKIPLKWKYVNIEQIESFIGSGITPKGGKINYIDKGIPFIRSQNVYPEGLRLDDVVYVSPELHYQMKRTYVHEGDVLLNITGASIGRSTFVPESFGEANVNQHVCIIRTNDNVNPIYLSWYLNSPEGQDQIMSKQSGQTRQGLNYSQLRSILVPLTGINEQKVIGDQLENIMSIIRNMITSLNYLFLRIKTIKQSILERAFCGDLVSQDPSDEPASVLLERIKAERTKDKFKRPLRNKKNTTHNSMFKLTPVNRKELKE